MRFRPSGISALRALARSERAGVSVIGVTMSGGDAINGRNAPSHLTSIALSGGAGTSAKATTSSTSTTTTGGAQVKAGTLTYGTTASGSTTAAQTKKSRPACYPSIS
ncbi:hypothetical protein [Sphingomonas abietis]|uniref:Uncharacterized protein n=1 Tax=Sphingomonas abietis TaxID=3012344 RepID=A0ABY7NQW8_9SPHN|nr:hypothetical protein [Sphingomonas abietis]WBO23778.1 hypothetical protein PBT88_06550 [Sphingomonas abietis]